mmetsp:Transcript_5983/g.4723  ORF Transcript_5983/g.4723 Transcript_5983/m.4723 type:complete len:150 (+) Transcript_5983:432-881(+)
MARKSNAPAPCAASGPIGSILAGGADLGLHLLLGLGVRELHHKGVLVEGLGVGLELGAMRRYRRLAKVLLQELVHLHRRLLRAGSRGLRAELQGNWLVEVHAGKKSWPQNHQELALSQNGYGARSTIRSLRNGMTVFFFFFFFPKWCPL